VSAWLSVASALLGVVVGILLSGAMQYLFERRREKLTARAAARLLYADLARISAIMGYPEYNVSEMFDPELNPEKTWAQVRGSVVGFLTYSEWDAVRLAWEIVAHYNSDPDYVRRVWSDKAPELVGEGYMALRRLAGFPRE
jgi:hypothetical protein